ncbi:TetR/AcrR family transcriptional regulator, partial [Mesorhizobium sp. M7A.F.Ca.CA.002.09.1.1]
ARNGVDLAARGLSAQLLADMLLDGLEGMKARIRDPEGQRQAAAALIRVIDLTLKA